MAPLSASAPSLPFIAWLFNGPACASRCLPSRPRVPVKARVPSCTAELRAPSNLPSLASLPVTFCYAHSTRFLRALPLFLPQPSSPRAILHRPPLVLCPALSVGPPVVRPLALLHSPSCPFGKFCFLGSVTWETSSLFSSFFLPGCLVILFLLENPPRTGTLFLPLTLRTSQQPTNPGHPTSTFGSLANRPLFFIGFW